MTSATRGARSCGDADMVSTADATAMKNSCCNRMLIARLLCCLLTLAETDSVQTGPNSAERGNIVDGSRSDSIPGGRADRGGSLR
jgi:hypothetical protein